MRRKRGEDTPVERRVPTRKDALLACPLDHVVL